MSARHVSLPPESAKAAAPFLKWAGGKSQLLQQYVSLFPPDRPARYFEPFVGSGAVFFHLWQQDFAGTYHLSDVNADLVNVFQAVRDDVNRLIDLLQAHKDSHAVDAKKHFYAVREQDRDPDWVQTAEPVERAARMIYLNKTCYNGLWRVNSRGEFNVPLGRYKNPAILDEARLRAASVALQGVDLSVRGFQSVVDRAESGDFVYFDPPYVPLSVTANFTSYAKDDFNDEDQRELADVFRKLSAKGCQVMLSNSATDFVQKLYKGKGITIHTVQARRAINTRADKRGIVSEVVVVNY